METVFVGAKWSIYNYQQTGYTFKRTLYMGISHIKLEDTFEPANG